MSRGFAKFLKNFFGRHFSILKRPGGSATYAVAVARGLHSANSPDGNAVRYREVLGVAIKAETLIIDAVRNVVFHCFVPFG